MIRNTLLTLLLLCCGHYMYGQITINEIDPDQSGTDMAEFVELLGTPGASADGYVLVLFNGSDDASYDAVDLDGLVFDANGLLVINFASNGLQNGADAVAVYLGDDTDFPNDTPVTTTNLIDAIVYGTNDSDDTGLLTGLGETVQYNDDTATSIQADGTGGYVNSAPTEGQPNTLPDCPSLNLNIGDACNDGDATTTGDVVLANCTCAGTPTGLNDCGAFTWEAVEVVNNSQTDVWTAITDGWTMNGYVGSGIAEQVDQWLVYGPLDLTSSPSFAASPLLLNFTAAEFFGTTDLNVAWTANYPGCPADATWTNAATVTDPGAISVDLSAAAGTAVYIGIEYSDDGADGYSDWDLTNFALLATSCPAVGTPVISMCTMPFDCPAQMANIGDACDDGNANTINDIIRSDCSCAGVIPVDIYISELSYNPCNAQGFDDDCEYLIITNAGATTADISDYTLANAITFTFPVGTTIPAGGTLSVGASANCAGLDPFDLTAFNDVLGNSGETVEILDPSGALVSSTTYDITLANGNCNANCFDAAGTVFECPSSLYTCPDSLSISNTIFTGIYQAAQFITSDGTVTDGVEFKAGNCIELKNDFTVPTNADFVGEIEDCNN